MIGGRDWPAREVTLALEDQHDNMDYTPCEGFVVRGWPVATVARGEVVVDDGELLAEPGRGGFSY